MHSLIKKDVDAFKGLLILLVVVGHNSFITRGMPDFNKLLYTFHVFLFFYLPFLFDVTGISCRALIDRLVRYGVPYTFFCVLAAALYFFSYGKSGDSLWLADFVVGFGVGSAPLLGRVTGFQLYWFLPAIFTLFVFRSFAEGLDRKWKRVLLVVFCVLHGFIGLFPQVLKVYAPLGVLIVIFVYPVGILCRLFWVRLSQAALLRLGVISFIGLLFSLLVADRLRIWINLAELRVYAVDNILMLLLQDLISLFAFFAFLGLSSIYSRFDFLVFLGRNSLLIYLVHSLYFQFVIRALSGLRLDSISIGVVSLVVTVLLSMLSAHVLNSSKRLKGLLFPKNFVEWRKECCG